MSKHSAARSGFILVALLSVLVFVAPAYVVLDPMETRWIPKVLDQGPAAMPVLVTDSHDQVHALWIHQFSLEDATVDAIFCARRNQDGTWTEPVDVLVPSGGVRFYSLAAAIDARDMIHVVSTSDAGLDYSQAQADAAGRATGWLKPRSISRARAGPSGIAVGADEVIHVIYPEIYVSPGTVFYIKSADGGATWSEPRAVSAPAQSQVVAANAQIAVANSGRLHVVWTEMIEDFPPSGVFYASSDDQGQTWSAPQMVAGRGYGWIGVGLEDDERLVHLVWTGTGDVAGKYHAISTNGGLTWSQPEQILYGWWGFLGFPVFALDSADNLHLSIGASRSFASQGQEWLGDPWSGHGDIFHSVWQGTTWSMAEHVSADVWSPDLEQAFPGMAVSEGNLLHIAWSGWYHPNQEDSRLWVASRRLDTPRIETATGMATATLPMTPSLGPAATPPEQAGTLATSAAEQAGREPPSSNGPVAQRQPLDPLLVGVAPALLLVAIVIGVAVFRGTRRR
jgi:hypothetical protein